MRFLKYPSFIDLLIPFALYLSFRKMPDVSMAPFITAFIGAARYFLALFMFGVQQSTSSNAMKKQSILIAAALLCAMLWWGHGFTWVFAVYFLSVWVLELMAGLLLSRR